IGPQLGGAQPCGDTGMRVRRVSLSDFKNVEVTLEWTPGIVLFGRNNAGKTNVLEALAGAFAEDAAARQDPLFLIEDPVGGSVEIELDGRGEPDHADREVLATMVVVLAAHGLPQDPAGIPGRGEGRRSMRSSAASAAARSGPRRPSRCSMTSS